MLGDGEIYAQKFFDKYKSKVIPRGSENVSMDSLIHEDECSLNSFEELKKQPPPLIIAAKDNEVSALLIKKVTQKGVRN